MSDEKIPTDKLDEAVSDVTESADVDEVAAEVETVVEEAAQDEVPAAEPEVKTAVEEATPAQDKVVEDVPAKKELGQKTWIAIACAALLVGLLVGRFLLGGGSGSAIGKTSLSESELDKPVAIVNYKGTTLEVSARDAIMQTSALEDAIDENGNYKLPTADAVLVIARDLILEREATNRGITVTDEDVAAYAEQVTGTSDYATIGANYQMSEEEVKTVLQTSCLLNKLHDDVVGTIDVEMPVAPDADESTAPDTESADFAAYIINLAGAEWDATTGTWVSPDGPYATALAEYKITPKSASYEAAQAAYYVAYQQYYEAAMATNDQWATFVNDLYANASIRISMLNQ